MIVSLSNKKHALKTIILKVYLFATYSTSSMITKIQIAIYYSFFDLINCFCFVDLLPAREMRLFHKKACNYPICFHFSWLNNEHIKSLIGFHALFDVAYYYLYNFNPYITLLQHIDILIFSFVLL